MITARAASPINTGQTGVDASLDGSPPVLGSCCGPPERTVTWVTPLAPATRTTTVPGWEPVVNRTVARPLASVTAEAVSEPLKLAPPGCDVIMKSRTTPGIGLPLLSRAVPLMSTAAPGAGAGSLAEAEREPTPGG